MHFNERSLQVKGKVQPEHAMKACRGSRSIALFFVNLGKENVKDIQNAAHKRNTNMSQNLC